MKPFLLAIALVLTGCGAPSRPASSDRYAAALVAWSVPSGVPSPAPKPDPGPKPGVCENCGGTGRLGDGRVSVPCPVCDGDGKTDGDKPPEPAEEPKTETPKPRATPTYTRPTVRGLFRR